MLTMRRLLLKQICLGLGLILGLLASPAQAQQPAAARAVGAYQYMHISYNAGSIIFLPAYNGKEFIKIADVREPGADKYRAPLEAMTKVLNDASADGWEVVSVVPITSAGGFTGMVYLLRKPR
jgi:hypothetical protein